MAYATVQDLEARWRPLSPAEQTRAATLLADAAVRIDSRVRPLPAGEDRTTDELARFVVVSCDMVRRALATSTDLVGVTQVQQTGGPFSQSHTYSNPMGDLYLSKADLMLLGVRPKAASINLLSES